MKYWFLVFFALAGASCRSIEPGEQSIAATTWVGFRVNELDRYDELNAREKDDLRTQFWLDLGQYKITCPPPNFVTTVHLRTDADGGVTPLEMETQVRAVLKKLDGDLDITQVKRQDYECIGGVPTCKRTFELLAKSRPFVTSHETRAGEISATADITLVIKLR